MNCKVYLTLEALFKGENSCVDGVFEFHVVVVALFQEGFSVDVVFAHRSGLPRKVGARRITLKKVKNCVSVGYQLTLKEPTSW